VCTCVYVNVRVYMCMYVYVFVYACVCVSVRMCGYVQTVYNKNKYYYKLRGRQYAYIKAFKLPALFIYNNISVYIIHCVTHVVMF